MVEAAGIEPASGRVSESRPTSVAVVFPSAEGARRQAPFSPAFLLAYLPTGRRLSAGHPAV